MWNEVLNYFFFGFHTSLILFNIFGWAFRRTRRYNLATLLLTGFSWFVLGFWYGWGYCFCTDWHWNVRRHMGYSDQTDSYIHFLLIKVTGINFPLPLVEYVTGIVFFTSLLLSIGLNLRDWKRD